MIPVDTSERNFLPVYHYKTAATGRERENEAQSARYFLNVQFYVSFQQAGKQAGKGGQGALSPSWGGSLSSQITDGLVAFGEYPDR